jgi:hypothetical protein
MGLTWSPHAVLSAALHESQIRKHHMVLGDLDVVDGVEPAERLELEALDATVHMSAQQPGLRGDLRLRDVVDEVQGTLDVVRTGVRGHHDQRVHQTRQARHEVVQPADAAHDLERDGAQLERPTRVVADKQAVSEGLQVGVAVVREAQGGDLEHPAKASKQPRREPSQRARRALDDARPDVDASLTIGR